MSDDLDVIAKATLDVSNYINGLKIIQTESVGTYAGITKGEQILQKIYQDRYSAFVKMNASIRKEMEATRDVEQQVAAEAAVASIKAKQSELVGISKINAAIAKEAHSLSDAEQQAAAEAAVASIKAKQSELVGISKINAVIAKEAHSLSDAEQQAAAEAAVASIKAKERANAIIIKAINDELDAEIKADQLAVKSSIEAANKEAAARKRIAQEMIADREAEAKRERVIREKAAADAISLANKVKRDSSIDASRALRIGAGVASFTGQYNIAGGLYALGNAADSAGIKVNKTVASLGLLGTVGAASFVAIAIEGEKMNVALASMMTLVDNAAYGTEAFFRLKDAAEQAAFVISEEFGKDSIEVVKMFKEAISSGVRVDELEEFGRAAGRLSASLGVDMNAASHILTSFKDTYELDVRDMNSITDMLFNVVNYGGASIEGVTTNFRRILPAAKQAGVGLQDLTAMYAVLTRTMKESNAATALSNFINSIANPSEKAKKAMEAVGMAYGDAAFKSKTALEVIDDMMKRVGTTSAQLGTVMEDAFALRGATSLSNLRDMLATIQPKMADNSTALNAMADVNSTLTQKMIRDWESVKNAIIEAGQATTQTGGILNGLYDVLVHKPLKYWSDEADYEAGQLNSRLDETVRLRQELAAVKGMGNATDYQLNTAQSKYDDARHRNGDLTDDMLDAREQTTLYDKSISASKEAASTSALIEKTLKSIPITPELTEAEKEYTGSGPSGKERDKLLSTRGTAEQLSQIKEMHAENAQQLKDINTQYNIDMKKGLLDLEEFRSIAAQANTQEAADGAKAMYELGKKALEIRLGLAKSGQIAELEINKKGVKELEEQVLTQRNHKEQEAEDKRIRIVDAANTSIAELTLEHEKKLDELRNRRVNLEEAAAKKIAKISEDAAKRDEDVNSDNRDLRGDVDNKNPRILRADADALRDKMHSAASAGNGELYDKLRQEAKSLYGQMRDADVAGGGNASRWTAKGGASFEAIFGEQIKINNETLKNVQTTQATAELQRQQGIIEKDTKSEEAIFNLKMEKQLDKIAVAGGATTTAVNQAAITVGQAINTSTQNIVASISILGKSMHQKANKENTEWDVGPKNNGVTTGPGVTITDNTTGEAIPGEDRSQYGEEIPSGFYDAEGNLKYDTFWDSSSNLDSMSSASPGMRSTPKVGGDLTFNANIAGYTPNDASDLKGIISKALYDFQNDVLIRRSTNKNDTMPGRQRGAGTGPQQTRKTF